MRHADYFLRLRFHYITPFHFDIFAAISAAAPLIIFAFDA
jgi:hypothetical protein